jgi:hypothetical protein
MLWFQAAEALPDLEDVASQACLQPSSETIDCWKAACGVLQQYCNYMSGDMPDAIYKLLDNAVQRLVPCPCRTRGSYMWSKTLEQIHVEQNVL